MEAQLKAERSPSKAEAITELAESIRRDGLLHPIGVLQIGTDEEKPRYRLLYGRRRYKAVKEKLKLESVAANVFQAIDAEDCVAITWAENLFRQELTVAQRSLGMQRWVATWHKRNPPEPEKPDETRPKRKPGQRGASDKGKALQELQQITGETKRSIKRQSAIAHAFTPDQLYAIDAIKPDITQKELENLAELKNLTQRAEAVNLVVAGLEVPAAIAEVRGEEYQPPPFVKTPAPAATDPPRAKGNAGDAELTDAQWLVTYVGDTSDKDSPRSRIRNLTLFDSEAIAYRKLREARIEFALLARRTVLRSAKNRGKGLGPFTALVDRLCSIGHPRDWLVCGSCNGQGVIGGTFNVVPYSTPLPATTDRQEADCPDCSGAGFVIRKEQ